MAPLQISTPITFENLYNKYHKLIQSIDCICWYLCHVIQRVTVQITAAKNAVEEGLLSHLRARAAAVLYHLLTMITLAINLNQSS